MDTRTISTASGTMAYVDEGDGDRVSLFVHGVGTSSHLWRHVVAEFRAERRCVAIDLPLHGATPPRADHSLPALAAAIEDFCDALGLTSVDLVANDTGGAVAQVFAAAHPERLRTFTLTNCDVHDNLPPPAFEATVQAAERGELAAGLTAATSNAAIARAIYATGYEHPDQLAEETLFAYVRPIAGTPERARAFEQLLVGLDAAELLAAEPGLRKLDVPTLVVWGTGDHFFDVTWAHWLRDTIPGASDDVVLIEGAKLFFPDERAAEFVPHLRRHWAEH